MPEKLFGPQFPEAVPEEWALSSFFSSTSALLCGFWGVEGAFLCDICLLGSGDSGLVLFCQLRRCGFG